LQREIALKSSIAIAALVVASIGLAVPVLAQSAPASSDGAQIGLSLDSSAPPADASQAAPGTDTGPGTDGTRHMMAGREMGPMGLLALACSPKGTEALDVALLRLSYKLNLTADQKPLFDTFREKALTTQTSFSDTCKTDRPTAAATADARPDFLTRLKTRLAIDQARLTALNDVLPSFEALYTSLTDAQKAALMPHPGMGFGILPWDRMDRPVPPGRG
jgi:hypothetical protein